MPRRSRIALIGAAASFAALVLIWLVAFHTGVGARADQSTFLGFAELQRPRVNGLANLVAHICDPTPFLALSALAVGLAFARGRARLAIVVGGIRLAGKLTTEMRTLLIAANQPPSMIPATGMAHSVTRH